MARPVRIGVVVAVVTAALALLALVGRNVATELRLRELVRDVPTIDRELARRLVADSPAAWDAYCREVGPRPLMHGFVAIHRALTPLSYADFAKRRRRLEQSMLRLGEGMGRETGFTVNADYARLALASSTPLDYRMHRLNGRYTDVLADTLLTPAERLGRLDRLIAEADSLGDPYQAMTLEFSAAEYELQLGRADRHRARLERTLSESRRLHDGFLTCQVLGTLGVLHEMAGRPDSGQACFDEALALARRQRFPDQAARLLSFSASHAAHEGRLAAAADLLQDASATADEMGPGNVRLRYALEYAKFYGQLGCWDLVQRALLTLPPLEREFPGRLERAEATKHAFDEDLIRARLAFATGDADAGQRLVEHWVAALPAWIRRTGLADIDVAWSWGLQSCGRDAAALALCERGLAHADSANVPEAAGELALRRVRLLEGMGRLAEARAALADAQRRIGALHDPPGVYEIAARVARARILLRGGDAAAGRRMAREVFATLERLGPASNPDATLRAQAVQGLSLREAVHELAGLSPAAGYGFEMAWRSLARRHAAIAAGRPPGPPADPLAETLLSGPGVHLVYCFTGRSLLRWTATSERVVLDTLAVPADRCLAEVREAISLLQSEAVAPGAWFGPRSRPALDSLTRQLLPADLRARPASRPLVEVSPDGPLEALPFEALPVGDAGELAPLAARTDVANVHAWGRPPVAPARPNLILADPALAPEVQRRYAWAGPLAGTDAEARAAARRWPDATVLSGAEATKPAFLRRAPGAAVLYVAAHHVRDAGAPFLGFVPLAGPPSASRADAFLEGADVRALDLSACGLVVLASCASGAPARVAAFSGASLGDAFLDAGARAVVQSYWDVGDEETGAFMERFLRTDAEAGDPVRALNRARREAMAGGRGVPPRVWAAWSIAVARR